MGVGPVGASPLERQFLVGRASPRSSDAIYLELGTLRFDPWVRKIPWRRKWQPTPVLLPGEFLGQRSLSGYSPWGYEESDTTEQLTQRPLERAGLDKGRDLWRGVACAGGVACRGGG